MGNPACPSSLVLGKSPYVGDNLVANAMRLNRFEVFEALFVEENARLDSDDRFCKLRIVSISN